LRLSDYKGTWLILFSHPADFTPVCTTEFMAFSEIYDELKKRNVELLGLSVDSVSSHIVWIRNCEEKMGVKIPFPIIADLNKEVAKKYGMIHPEQSKTETVRCVFIIDPESKIRAIALLSINHGQKHERNPEVGRRPADNRQVQGSHPRKLETRRLRRCSRTHHR
jgi:peroxiredoxin (alkyl hydroperoxide reductase subunit C)